MREQKWSQRFGGFVESEVEMKMLGCCGVRALGSSDGGEAQAGRRVENVSMHGVAGVRMV